MNTEQIEYELTLLTGKQIIVIVPVTGKSSIAYSGELQMVTTPEHLVGFHVASPLGGWAIIFYADDVASLESCTAPSIAKTVRLKKIV